MVYFISFEWKKHKNNILSLNVIIVIGDDLSTSQWGDHEEAPTAGLNSILPKEHGNKFYSLPLIRQCEADVSAVGAWDSSVHDSQYLNRVTDSKLNL